MLPFPCFSMQSMQYPNYPDQQTATSRGPYLPHPSHTPPSINNSISSNDIPPLRPQHPTHKTLLAPSLPQPQPCSYDSITMWPLTHPLTLTEPVPMDSHNSTDTPSQQLSCSCNTLQQQTEGLLAIIQAYLTKPHCSKSPINFKDPPTATATQPTTSHPPHP